MYDRLLLMFVCVSVWCSYINKHAKTYTETLYHSPSKTHRGKDRGRADGRTGNQVIAINDKRFKDNGLL